MDDIDWTKHELECGLSAYGKPAPKHMSTTCKTALLAGSRLPIYLPFVSHPLLYARGMRGAFQRGIVALLRGGKARLIQKYGSYRSVVTECPSYEVGADQGSHWVIEMVEVAEKVTL
jgi:hypothetical protein